MIYDNSKRIKGEKMKKRHILGGLLFLFALYISNPMNSMAALVIEEDEELFFSTEEIEYLEETYTDSHFDYLIKSVSQMENEAIESEAEMIFLEANVDALLLIHQNEVQFQTAADSAIEDAILQGQGSNAYEEILNDTFINGAEQDDFVLAVESLINEIEERFVNLEMPNESGEMIEEETIESEAITIPSTANNGPNITWFSTILFLAISLAVLTGVRIVLKKQSDKKRIAELSALQERQKKLLSGVLQPYNNVSERLKLSKGQTVVALKQLEKQLFYILTNAKERDNHIEDLLGQSLKTDDYALQVENIEVETENDERLFTELTEETDTVMNSEKKASEQINQLKENIGTFETKFQSSIASQTNSFSFISSTLEEVNIGLNKAEELEKHLDYVGASQLLETLTERFNEMDRDFSLLQDLKDSLSSIKQNMNKQKELLMNQIADESLHTIVHQVEQAFIKIEQAFSNLSNDVMEGKAKAAEDEKRFIDKQLEEVSELVESLIFKRDHSWLNLEKMEQELLYFKEKESDFDRELNRLQKQYNQVHWHDLQSLFYELNNRIQSIKTVMGEVKRSLDEQHYEEAYEETERLKFEIQEIDQMYVQCFARFEELESERKQLLDQMNHLEREISKLLHTVNLEAIPMDTLDISRLLNQTQFEKNDLQQGIVHLGEFQEKVRQLEQQYEKWLDELTFWKKKKAELDRQWSVAKRSYEKAERRYEKDMPIHSYRREFSYCEREIQRLLAAGQYNQASNQLQLLEQIPRDMKKDYEQFNRDIRRSSSRYEQDDYYEEDHRQYDDQYKPLQKNLDQNIHHATILNATQNSVTFISDDRDHDGYHRHYDDRDYEDDYNRSNRDYNDARIQKSGSKHSSKRGSSIRSNDGERAVKPKARSKSNEAGKNSKVAQVKKEKATARNKTKRDSGASSLRGQSTTAKSRPTSTTGGASSFKAKSPTRGATSSFKSASTKGSSSSAKSSPRSSSSSRGGSSSFKSSTSSRGSSSSFKSKKK